MTETQCLAREKLRSYVLGELPEPESFRVLSHLEECSDCEATVSALDRESDTLIESLRTPVVQPEPVSVYRLAAKRVAACLPDPPQDSDQNTPLRTLRDYELLEPLARGGMGMVYRARHMRLNRQVAIKVLPARWLKDPTVVARFEREMQAVGSLRHPAIVQATDGGEADDVHFLVMELVDGLDGAALVRCCGPLPIADACEIVRQAASGMAYVHANGIVHRDLKPSNLMITVAGEVKILDLGLARITGEQLTDDELTTVGQLMGTLQYMAPEQLENSHQVDERTDVFSLGATLYKLLTGTTPHWTPPREPLISQRCVESPRSQRHRLPIIAATCRSLFVNWSTACCRSGRRIARHRCNRSPIHWRHGQTIRISPGESRKRHKFNNNDPLAMNHRVTFGPMPC